MKYLFSAVVFAMLCGSVLAAQNTKERLAGKAALAWLSLVDTGEYEKSWEQASLLFRKQVPARQWKTAITSVRTPLGKLVSRKLKSTQFTTTLPGAPDGEYVVIQYDCSYEKKKSAVETVTPMREEDGSWKVSGYYIR